MSLDPKISAALMALSAFRSLDHATRQALQGELQDVQLAAGDVLFRQGDPGDSMYILLHGGLNVSVHGAEGGEVIVKQFNVERPEYAIVVGEIALISGQPRSATISASRDASLARLSSSSFQKIAGRYPQLVREFERAILPRLQGAQIASIFTAIFGELEADAFEGIQGQLDWLHLESGQSLFLQGENGDAMYIVVRGLLRIVHQDAEGEEHLVSEVSSGETVGEFALLTDEPRNASVYAVRDTNLVRLSRPVFEDLMQRYPQAMLQITRIIIRRLKRAMHITSAPPVYAAAIAVAPVSSGTPLAEFTAHLVAALETLGPTLHLSADSFDRAFGKPGAAQTDHNHPTDLALVAWLNEREVQYRYIIYETETTWSNWTQRCLRQADQVLFVALANANPAVGEIENLLQDAYPTLQSELALVWPDQTERPVGTMRWLGVAANGGRRNLRAHHHVRPNHSGDFKRLARRLAGKSLGLVLSGGGAPGFGHLGAIRAIEEAGLEVDMVGGTSMGSLVAGMYATGRSLPQLIALAEQLSQRQNLIDYTFPLVSFLESKKLTQLLLRLAGDLQIEDLWRPFFCVSCNISHGKEHIHESGPLWQAIRASAAFPGIFSPVLVDGDLLVDGGAINNYPVDVMRARIGSGTVIGVAIAPTVFTRQQYHIGPSISGWPLLWQRLNPFGARDPVPTIFDNLARTTELNSQYRMNAVRSLADLNISLRIEGYGLLEIESYREIMEIGYETAKRELAEWRDEK